MTPRPRPCQFSLSYLLDVDRVFVVKFIVLPVYVVRRTRMTGCDGRAADALSGLLDPLGRGEHRKEASRRLYSISLDDFTLPHADLLCVVAGTARRDRPTFAHAAGGGHSRVT